MHLKPLHHAQAARVKRQQQTANGIAQSTAVAQGDDAPQTLVYDQDVSVSVAVTVPFAASQPVSTVTPTTTPAPTTSEPPPLDTAAPASTAGKSSNTGLLVGACIGAFIGAALLLSLVLFWLKRQNRNVKAARQVRQARSASDARNTAGEAGRRRSRLEPWTKLEESGDGGEKAAKHDMTQRSPNEMENMTMFKKSPSMRSNYTLATSAEGTAEGGNYFGVDPAMLSKYHNGLAEELATAGEAPASKQQPRQFLGRLDTDPAPVSWDGETVGDESFLTLRSMRVSGTMSPTPGSVAKQTPPATAHGEHQWHSAVVVQPEEIENPFEDDVADTPRHNPFFSAHDREGLPKDRKVNRSRSRSQSRSRAAKYAESADPFADVHAAKARAMAESGHRSTESTLSVTSDAPSERAMASLLAALDISPGEAHERLQLGRASVAETFTSSIAYDEDEQQAIQSFPLPPSSHESHRAA